MKLPRKLKKQRKKEIIIKLRWRGVKAKPEHIRLTKLGYRLTRSTRCQPYK